MLFIVNFFKNTSPKTNFFSCMCHIDIDVVGMCHGKHLMTATEFNR